MLISLRPVLALLIEQSTFAACSTFPGPLKTLGRRPCGNFQPLKNSHRHLESIHQDVTCAVSALLGSNLSNLPLWTLRQQCRGCVRHIHLQGLVWLRSGEKTWLTAVAGGYPPQLARQWARELVAAAPAAGLAQHGFALLRKNWEGCLNQAIGDQRCPAQPRPQCPRCFHLPFAWDCKRVWTCW